MKYPMSRLVAVGLMLALAACANQPVPGYEASYDNVQKLKAAGAAPASVAPFTGKSDKANLSAISVRGSRATSPVGTGFNDYVKEALEQELQRAELLSPTAPLQISGVVLENDIDAASGTGTATLSVEITVTNAGAERFRKVFDAKTSWESSFVGAIAIPRAFQSYPKVVETLLRTIYVDPGFTAAVKAPPPAESPPPPVPPPVQ